MLALLQRVHWAEVAVGGAVAGRIEKGLLVYVGIAPTDALPDAEKMARKIAELRIFPDHADKLNLSVRDARGGVLAIPNFTLLADARKGRRPAFNGAAPLAQAEPVYRALLEALRRTGIPVAAGVFGADMVIRSQADGPVNVLVEMPPRLGPAGGGGNDMTD